MVEATPILEQANIKFDEINSKLSQLSRGSLAILLYNRQEEVLNRNNRVTGSFLATGLYMGFLDFQNTQFYPYLSQNPEGNLSIKTIGFIQSREIDLMSDAPPIHLGSIVAEGVIISWLAKRLRKSDLKKPTNNLEYRPEFATEILGGTEAEEWLQQFQHRYTNLARAQNYLKRKLQASRYL